MQYPEYDEDLNDPESEAAYELILGCSKGIRSLIAEYKIEQAKGTTSSHHLTPKNSSTKTSKAFVHASDATTYDTAKSQLQAIKSLSGKSWSTIEILSPSDPTPTGCAVYAVSTSAAAFLQVTGQASINIDEEISKLQQKMKKASDSASKQKKLMASDEFKTKVSAAVQEEERKKFDEFCALQGNYERTILQFDKLKVQEGEGH